MNTKLSSLGCALALSLLGLIGLAATLQASDPPTPPVVHILATDPCAAEEGSDPATFTVIRIGPTNAPLTVYYEVGGTAGNGLDYQTLSGAVEIPAGAYTAPVTVTPIEDFLVEGGESVIIGLRQPLEWPPPYLVCWPSIALAHIEDNDFEPTNRPPVVAIVNPPDGTVLAAPVDVAIVARASDPDGRVRTVEFFADNVSLGIVTNRPMPQPEPVVVADGVATLDVAPEIYPDLNVDPIRDPIPVPINLFRLVWSNVPPGRHVLTALATDNLGASSESAPIHLVVLEAPPQPVVTVRATDPEAAETGPTGTRLDTATFTLHRTGPTDLPLTVFYRLSGTASNGVDYRELPSSVTIPRGEPTANVVIEPIDDTLVEGDESVGLTVVPPICIAIYPPPPDCYLVGDPHTARAVIHDNDTLPNRPPVVQIVRPLDGSVFLAPATLPIVAQAWDFDGRVVAVEFFEGTNSLGIVRNDPSSITNARPPFMLVWSNVPAGRYVLTAVATDDDGATGRSRPVEIKVAPHSEPPVVNIVATDPIASEPGVLTVIDDATFAVSRTGSTQWPLVVRYSISGTASNGVDYRPLSGHVTIPAGAVSTNIVVDPLHDLLVEGTETVGITLEPPVCIAIYPPPPECYYVVGRSNRAWAAIRDNDLPPTNLPPKVAIVRPQSGDVFAAFADITIYAAAFDADGFVRMVEFFEGTNSLGVVSNSFSNTGAGSGVSNITVNAEQVFRLVWSNVPPGGYILSAKATDNRGASSMSEPVRIRVLEPPLPPVVTIIASDPYASEGDPVVDPTRTTSGNVGYIGPPIVISNDLPHTATFTVRRTGGTNVDLTVYYEVAGTASNGIDYRRLSGQVTIPSGAWTAPIVVVPIDDQLIEGTETVVVGLLPAPNRSSVDLPGTGMMDSFIIQGVMHFTNVEGGCWQFVATDGSHYELVGPLAASLQREGLRATLRVRLRLNMVSICMVGQIAEVLEIMEPMPAYIVGDPSRAVAYIRDNDFNLLPKAEIVQPSDGALFRAGSDIEINVVAVDPDGYVPRVEFYEGTNLIGVQEIYFLVPPPPGQVQRFSMTWSNVPMGAYILTARPTDNRGGKSVSDPVRIKVVDIIPIPVVTIVATDPVGSEIDPRLDRIPDPARFTVQRKGDLTEPLRVFYRVSGTASNGVDYEKLSGEVEIPKGAATADILIDVIDDTLVEGTESVIIALEQLRCVTTNVPPVPGCYIVGEPGRAVAYIRDDDSPPNKPPTVALVSPPNGSVFTAPADIRLVAAANDPDGWVATVEFFANGTSIGIVTNRPWIVESVRLPELNGTILTDPTPISIPIPPPIVFNWLDVQAGRYELVAVATDNVGASARSGAIQISVLEQGHVPIVNIMAIDAFAREGTTNTATFKVRRCGSTNELLTVHYAIAGTASNGVDYVRIPGSVTIPAGRRSARITILPIDDRLIEPIETVILRLQPSPLDVYPPPYYIGRPACAGAIILDNDRPRPCTQQLADGRLHVRVPMINGLPYRLEASCDLVNWEPVVSNIVNDDGIDFVEAEPENCNHRFYRVVPEVEVVDEEE